MRRFRESPAILDGSSDSSTPRLILTDGPGVVD
jgi:hypothetical protein